MRIVVLVLFFILVLFSFSSYAYHCNCQNDFCQCVYSIQDIANSYRCECKSPNLCVCTDGVTSVTAILPVSNLILSENEATQICPKDFLNCRSVPWLGKICFLTESCIADVARVVSVNFPFLSVDMIENAERTASVYVQKSISLADSVRYFLSTILSNLGIGSEYSSVQNLTKGKTLAAMKKQAENQKIDLTTYLFSQIVRDHFHNETLKLSDYFATSRFLQNFYNAGKLSDFISFYLVASPVIRNSIFKNKLFAMYNILSNSTKTMTAEEFCSKLFDREEYEKLAIFAFSELKNEIKRIDKKADETLLDRVFNETLQERLREEERKQKECVAIFKRNKNTDERILTKAVLSYSADRNLIEEKKERMFPVLFFFAGIFITVIFILHRRRKSEIAK